MKLHHLLLAVLFAGTLAFAQPTREGPRDRRPEGGPEGGPPGAGPRGGSPQHPMAALNSQVEAMRAWNDMIEKHTRLARDPAAVGVAAVVGANDLLRNKPPREGIDFFTKMLGEVKNEAVQRAIRLQLVELHIKANQPDQAMEQLRTLMIAAPALTPPPESPARQP